MHDNKPKPPGDQLTLRGMFYVLLLILKSHATCFTVFTRHTFGREALGWNGLGAFFLILVYGGVANAPEMFRFFWVWLAALIVQRLRTGWAVMHGYRLHSHDGGYPWLGYLTRLGKTHEGALLAEYAVVFFTGVFLLPVSQAIALFTITGSWSLLLVYAIQRQGWLMDARRMRDAEIEMQNRSEFFQNRDNHF